MEDAINVGRQSDGYWVATSLQVPGLAVYGPSREEAVASARTVSTILLSGCLRPVRKILAFYPGLAPESAHLEDVVDH